MDARGGSDASVRDASADATVVVAPPGTVRFVNVAPDAPALDVCVKPSSVSSYTGTPLFAARSIVAGLPYRSTSPYLDLGLDPGVFYDLEFVGASTHACSPPIYAAIGNRRFPSDASTTIAVYEYQFAPIAAYNGAQMTDQGTPTKGDANVRFYFASQGASQTADVHGAVGGGSETTWFPAVQIGTGTAFHAASPGNYSLRVTSGGTQTVLAQASGVTLAADQWVDAFLLPTSTTSFSLLRCPSSVSTVTACTP
jgi:predicted enzyme related to lactoylglutathione lyase